LFIFSFILLPYYDLSLACNTSLFLVHFSLSIWSSGPIVSTLVYFSSILYGFAIYYCTIIPICPFFKGMPTRFLFWLFTFSHTYFAHIKKVTTINSHSHQFSRDELTAPRTPLGPITSTSTSSNL